MMEASCHAVAQDDGTFCVEFSIGGLRCSHEAVAVAQWLEKLLMPPIQAALPEALPWYPFVECRDGRPHGAH
jgi:hypothetical protein